jgi:glutamate-1-semialdehyde 2,1-aminomutase
MTVIGERTREWHDRAMDSLVLGVSSQYRFWGEGETFVLDRGEGTYVWDMDGRRYIDYRLGFGPVILGHSHPPVADAVAEAARGGTTFAMTQRREIEAAERFREAIPWADKLRFTNTGTEATMHAIRLARGFTGRELIVKFEGQYHGMHDYVLWSTAGTAPSSLGSRRDPIPVQSSSGIPEAIRSTVRTLPFNDLEGVDRLLRREGSAVAAILVEPVIGNCFAIMPDEGFLEGLRDLCDEHGALLIFDEVKTGFRIARGGAQEFFGVTPDIATFAKALGNGFPVAAIAVRDVIAEEWRPGRIAQAGTYSANAVAVAAAAATLDELARPGPWESLERAGRTLMDGIAKICEQRGVAAHVLGVPAMFGLFLADEAPSDFRDTVEHDEELYERLGYALIRRGVMIEPDGLEPWFLCAALTDEDVSTTLTVFEEALDEAVG